MKTLLTLAALLLCSCGGEIVDDDTTGDPPWPQGPRGGLPDDILEGQSGTEVPDLCLETDRTVVTDTSLIPAGFAFSIDDLLSEVSGTWSGSIDLDGGQTDIAVDLALAAGPIYAVDTEWVVSGGSGDPQGTGALGGAEAADGDCLPYYELPMTVSVQSGTLLQESFEVVATSRAADDLDYSGTLDPQDVLGTTEPTFDPDDYDSYALGVFGDIFESTLRGAVVWRGINESDESPPQQEPCEIADGIMGCLDPETGTCGACVGSVGPPSIVEFVGHFDAQK